MSFELVSLLILLVITGSAFALCVHAAITGKFPTITIKIFNSRTYLDNTPIPEPEPCPIPLPVQGLASTPDRLDPVKITPTVKEEPATDPLSDMIGIAHELFTGGDRVEPNHRSSRK